MVFNLDVDLKTKLVKTVKPGSLVFRALPVEEQVRRLLPVLLAQQARDRRRFALYRRAA